VSAAAGEPVRIRATLEPRGPAAAVVLTDEQVDSHRKELARWVDDAKRAETRERRAAEAIRMLHEGRTR
jgi:hypothetical protein